MGSFDWIGVYVTRPFEGQVARHSLRVWQAVAARWLVVANVIAWGVVGLIAAGHTIAGWL